ncbi:MAG TPA: efflux RND transporter periplasmic adaptor subunit [Nitrospirae bacterium]|nr:Efflux pump periplasmic linker BepF [bacterium BMS3Abin10]GBE39518.1 Efflux pump periplasmic linker BepF [bacterium BMS3Bbin08]HDH51151.1 efflux RND transporter periplasmic adaptor subunit [Nitrospirota bacterium]HDK80958.1 efflux RND transporter periplasmic adaptor subunit [Nitrospirota bacterium]
MKLFHQFIGVSLIILLNLSILYAQEKKPRGGGMPPANVVVSEVSTGMVAPEAEFIGTVYFQEVSDVSCEVDGKVEEVNFEEGQRVKKGTVLVRLNTDLLLSDLKKATLNFNRAEHLYKEELISEEVYDEHRFELERLEISLGKKTIVAPFEGVIIKKHVEIGEWISPGSTVATIAMVDMVDIVVDVPESIVSFIKQDMNVLVKAGGKEIKGRVFAVIPSGDISTRTFPVKIRTMNRISLKEGMEARVILPVGDKQQTLSVPRDAVISKFGMMVVFAVIDSRAKMLSVKVAGYEGLKAGVFAEGLSEGMKVVIKGNERLMDGQPVIERK